MHKRYIIVQYAESYLLIFSAYLLIFFRIICCFNLNLFTEVIIKYRNRCILSPLEPQECFSFITYSSDIILSIYFSFFFSLCLLNPHKKRKRKVFNGECVGFSSHLINSLITAVLLCILTASLTLVRHNETEEMSRLFPRDLQNA